MMHMNRLGHAVLAVLGLAAMQARAADQAQLDLGKAKFQQWCAPCHASVKQEPGMMGMPLPGTMSIQVKYKGQKPGALEEWTDLTAELVKAVVRNGVQSMPFFRKTELSNAELDAVAAYLSRSKTP